MRYSLSKSILNFENDQQRQINRKNLSIEIPQEKSEYVVSKKKTLEPKRYASVGKKSNTSTLELKSLYHSKISDLGILDFERNLLVNNKYKNDSYKQKSQKSRVEKGFLPSIYLFSKIKSHHTLQTSINHLQKFV